MATQREATRARILAAAQASLLEHGYAATSTLAVQERAGVSRGALLHHFPTRALLFGARRAPGRRQRAGGAFGAQR